MRQTGAFFVFEVAALRQGTTGALMGNLDENGALTGASMLGGHIYGKVVVFLLKANLSVYNESHIEKSVNAAAAVDCRKRSCC